MNTTQLPAGTERNIEGGIELHAFYFYQMFYDVRSDFYGDASKFYCHAVSTLARAM